MIRIRESRHLRPCRQKGCTRRRVQWNKETAYITSEWSSWEVPPESVWRSRRKRHHKGPSSLSPQATRNEFRTPSRSWKETHRATHSICRMNQPSKTSLRSLAHSITWFSPLAIASICTTLPPQISNRPDAPLTCVIGLYWLRLNTEAVIFARAALSCSPPELRGSARKNDGLLPQVSAEQSRP